MANELRSAAFTISINGDEKGRSIVQIVSSLEQMDRITQKVQKTLGEGEKIEGRAVETTRERTMAVRRLIAEQLKQQKQTDHVIESIRNENKALTMTAKGREIYNAQMAAGVNPLSAQGKEIANLISKQQQLAKSSQGSMRALRGQAQNFGWQMQDIAVQAQMGTDKMVILSQQGSQLASGFGPQGALIGALIAVGGAIAGVMLKTKGLAEAQKITKVTTVGLTEKLYEQAKAGKKLNKETKAYALILQDQKIANYRKEIERVTKELSEQEAIAKRRKKLEQDGSVKRYGASAGAGYEVTFGKQTDVERIRSNLSMLNKDYETAIKNRKNLQEGKAFEDPDAEDKVAKQVRSTIDAWKDKLAVIEFTDRQTELYNANVEATTDAEKSALPELRNVINAYFDKAEAIEANNIATKELMKSISDEEKAMAKRARLMDKIENKQIKQREKYDPVQAEIDSFKQNMANLQQMKTDAGEYSIMEQIRLNGLIEAEEERHQIAMQDAYLKQAENYLTLGSFMAGQMTALADAWSGGGEQIKAQMEEMNGAQKAMFVITQAFTAANAVLGGYAQAAMWQQQAPATVSAVMAPASIALGYANAGSIMGMAFAGAFDNGGKIGSNQAGIVSEYGAELVNGALVMGAASVTSREDTAKLLGGGNVNIYNNAPDTNINAKRDENGDTNIYVTKKELPNLIGAMSSDPSSKLNRGQSKVYRKERR